MEEIGLYGDKKGVSVTTARLMVKNATYAMANIASVQVDVRKPKDRKRAIVLAVIFAFLGLIAAHSLAGLAVVFFGLAVVSALFAARKKATYVVRVTSASGKTEPIESTDKKYCEQIVQAINEAIVRRG